MLKIDRILTLSNISIFYPLSCAQAEQNIRQNSLDGNKEDSGIPQNKGIAAATTVFAVVAESGN